MFALRFILSNDLLSLFFPGVKKRKCGCSLKSVKYFQASDWWTNQETGNSSVVYVQIPSYFYKGKSSKLWYIGDYDSILKLDMLKNVLTLVENRPAA